ncbi:polyketide cyclase / dehydrase and lipid transport family protein [Mycobacterium xenopi 3993]|nr:polyketide cyclase / dehydrase and lipid transport family protein [Mycobacterium xenopi 3993]
MAGLGAYGVSKAALERLVEAWRAEHPGIGFTCLIVGECAGGEGDAATGMTVGWDPGLAKQAYPLWVSRGCMPGKLMPVKDLVEVVDTILRTDASTSMPVVVARGAPANGRRFRIPAGPKEIHGRAACRADDCRACREGVRLADGPGQSYGRSVGPQGWLGARCVGASSGALREVVGVGTWFREEITAYDRPRTYSYLIVRSLPPFNHEGGTLTFTPSEAGTHVDWLTNYTHPLRTGASSWRRSPAPCCARVSLRSLRLARRNSKPDGLAAGRRPGEVGGLVVGGWGCGWKGWYHHQLARSPVGPGQGGTAAGTVGWSGQRSGAQPSAGAVGDDESVDGSGDGDHPAVV